MGETLEDVVASGTFDTALSVDEWMGNEWSDHGEDEVSEEVSEVERKWVRLQAALDELGDTLAIRLRTIVGKLKEGEVQDATELLEEMIESVEVFSGPSEADEADET
jgi:hypothetical protein